MDKPRAILVSVDYDDVLAITLSYNRHHFSEVMVVTTPADSATRQVAAHCNAQTYLTDSFYDDGALFNKWKALEEGLALFGRYGLLCIMDADVLWPKSLDPFWFSRQDIPMGLYSPYRRIYQPTAGMVVLPEELWPRAPLYRDYELAGYTQVFWAEDPVLRELQGPWHETDWKHAGGADSAFQNLWSAERKYRPSWQVLHLGEPGRNWGGRVTPRLDGRAQSPELLQERSRRLQEVMEGRLAGRGYAQERFSG